MPCGLTRSLHLKPKSQTVHQNSHSMSTVTFLPKQVSKDEKPAHHVGNPPTSFINPWPSFDASQVTGLKLLKTKLSRDRPAFIPVPERSELVPIRKPDWSGASSAFKLTWIGHASFLVESSKAGGRERGVRILFDPVFSERTSPTQFFGPKRYSPTPCAMDELPDVDAVVISHNHYDHLDLATITYLSQRRKRNIHFFAPLGNASWFISLGIPSDQVTELDWWDATVLDVPSIGKIQLTCTPNQHGSGRSILDHGSTLWSSWALREIPIDETKAGRKLFFAGDTGYRSVPSNGLAAAEEAKFPSCPAFKEVGEQLGPFDVALLPIGLCEPRHFMSPVHCNPWDSVEIHKDIKSKVSIGMHWGTVRGGLSQDYEDVRDPPRWWKQASETAGLKWGQEARLLDVGETFVVE